MDKLIKQIKSEDIESVYRQVTEAATIWAICGFIEQANRLLEKLWSLKLEHSRNTWLNDEGFQFFWAITGKKPNHIPFQFKDIDSMQAENWQRHFLPYWNSNVDYATRVKGKKWTELSGYDLVLVGIGLAYDETNTNRTSDKKQQLDALSAIVQFINTCKPDGHSLMNSLVCASILAARNDLNEQARELLIQWAEAYKLYWANTSPTFLMRDLKTARILLTGILSPFFKLTKEKCESDLQVISDALDSRITKGRSLVYENLEWEELLKRISTKAIQKADFDYENKNVSKNWIGFSPATKEEVANVEKRLNVKLPKEYKDFLTTTNGFNPFSLTPTLLSADKIDWLKNLDPQLVELWNESLQGVDEDFVKSFSNSILIGGYQEEQQLLLIPSTKANDWECWFFANWNAGETKYPSFRYYMESQLQQLETEA